MFLTYNTPAYQVILILAPNKNLASTSIPLAPASTLPPACAPTLPPTSKLIPPIANPPSTSTFAPTASASALNPSAPPPIPALADKASTSVFP